MLRRAVLYKDKINNKVLELMDDDYFKYWFSSWNEFDLFKDESDYSKLQFASIYRNDDALGYFSAGVDREMNYVTYISAINFTKNKNITFSKDFFEFLDMLFSKYKFEKINWSVLIGNPAEAMYDKIVEKYNGRIIGIRKKDAYTATKELVDVKLYELFRSDYLLAK